GGGGGGQQRSVSPTRKCNNENHSTSCHQNESSIYNQQLKQEQHHDLESSSRKYLHRHSRHHRYASYHHNLSKSSHHHQRSDNHPYYFKSSSSSSSNTAVFRCIEDRIESAKKLVKKLHKLCPFYDVTTTGIDAGRVYCRICDRYLGAVSSTLKNHVNTQEHRQACEDSHQQQQFTTTAMTAITDVISTPQLAFAATSGTPSSQPIISYANNGQDVGQMANYVDASIITRSSQSSNIIGNQQQQHQPLASATNQIQWQNQPKAQNDTTIITNGNRESEYQTQQQLYRSTAAPTV
ncbi:hypothetical protein BLA29_007283, partial [Euroglyphus maynei]